VTSRVSGASISDAFARGGSAVIDVDSYRRRVLEGRAVGVDPASASAGTASFRASVGAAGENTETDAMLPPALHARNQTGNTATRGEQEESDGAVRHRSGNLSASMGGGLTETMASLRGPA